jgi:hypothetical protein
MKKTLLINLVLVLVVALLASGYQWKDENGQNINMEFANGGSNATFADEAQSVMLGAGMVPFNSTGIGYDIHQGLFYIVWSNVRIGAIVYPPGINCSITYRGIEWGEINCSSPTGTTWQMAIKENGTGQYYQVFDTRLLGERKFIGLKEAKSYVVEINVTNPEGVSTTTLNEFRTQTSGELNEMMLAIGLFLLMVNLGLFLTPYLVKKMTDNVVSDYVIKKMFIIAGFVVLWFNSLIFRIVADSAQLAITQQLFVLWWIFTLGMIICIFAMVYVMVRGVIKMIEAAQLKKRMGDEA